MPSAGAGVVGMHPRQSLAGCLGDRRRHSGAFAYRARSEAPQVGASPRPVTGIAGRLALTRGRVSADAGLVDAVRLAGAVHAAREPDHREPADPDNEDQGHDV